MRLKTLASSRWLPGLVLVAVAGVPAGSALAADERSGLKAPREEGVSKIQPRSELKVDGGKRFLTAKKAFHKGRQEIQSIKKGDQDPTQGAPASFGE